MISPSISWGSRRRSWWSESCAQTGQPSCRPSSRRSSRRPTCRSRCSPWTGSALDKKVRQHWQQSGTQARDAESKKSKLAGFTEFAKNWVRILRTYCECLPFNHLTRLVVTCWSPQQSGVEIAKVTTRRSMLSKMFRPIINSYSFFCCRYRHATYYWCRKILFLRLWLPPKPTIMFLYDDYD